MLAEPIPLATPADPCAASAPGDAAIDAPADRAVRPTFEPLDAGAIRAALPGWDANVVDETGSTNTDLLRSVRGAGRLSAPRFLACEVQRAGRGRLGRRWSATPGASLTLSVAVDVARRLAALDGATLVCGLAVLDAIRDRGVGAALKWPNDVVVGDRKLAGILVEAHPVGDATTVVVGVGVNVMPVVVDGADGLTATSLAEAGGGDLDRSRLAVAVARGIEARLALFARHGFAPFVDAWNTVDAWRDRAVCLHVSDGAPARRGIARGVDVTGALRLDVDGIVERVVSGALSLRADAPA